MLGICISNHHNVCLTVYTSFDRNIECVPYDRGRALGIATRPVTNFESSHDTDYNRAIEKYFLFDKDSKTYEPTDGESGDSVWFAASSLLLFTFTPNLLPF